MGLGFALAIVISGFITGALARLALPGPDPMPIWLTTAIGLVGSIVGALVGRAISGGNGYAVSFVSLGVAIALVAAYRHFVQRRPIWGPGALRFPDRGLGVEQQRERLSRLGVDPDALNPMGPRMERMRLTAMLDELHREGILDDEELAAKRELVERRGEATHP
jgi:uncharacterized membrane protein YeaQ/YmgE (transglycosylase-associated protein family)